MKFKEKKKTMFQSENVIFWTVVIFTGILQKYIQ